MPDRREFGATPDGTPVFEYRLAGGGLEARLCDFGATLVSLLAPDRSGRPGEVTLGFDDLAGYLDARPYIGATVGRCASRISGARFRLDGREFRLAANEGPNHLHGGRIGFDRRVWRVEEVTEDRAILALTSPDGEEGYPGALEVRASFALGPGPELRIDWHATTDAPTVVNLTCHAYFNLRDGGTSDVLDHRLRIDASRYTPVDGAGIPTGEIAPVEGTPFDFRAETRIGARIDRVGGRGGYDHNFALDGRGLRRAARLTEPRSGRALEVHTTQPAVLLYTGNSLDGVPGRGGVRYERRHGLCLETQHFPDSPNHPEFPSTVLRPGEAYDETVIYRFSTV
jgi:aldose 1-epimerase